MHPVLQLFPLKNLWTKYILQYMYYGFYFCKRTYTPYTCSTNPSAEICWHSSMHAIYRPPPLHHTRIKKCLLENIFFFALRPPRRQNSSPSQIPISRPFPLPISSAVLGGLVAQEPFAAGNIFAACQESKN